MDTPDIKKEKINSSLPSQNAGARASWKELMKSVWYLLDLGGVRSKYVIGATLLFVIFAYSVIPPLIIGSIVNFFSHYKAGQSLNPFYLLIALLGGLIVAVSFFRLTIKEKLGMYRNVSVYQIKVKGFEKLLAQSLTETGKDTTGAKAQKILNGINAFNSFFRILTNQILSSLASFIGIIAILIYVKFYYALFFAAYMVIFYFLLKLFAGKLQQLNFEKNRFSERASGTYIEGLSNISTLKSLGSEEDFRKVIIEKESLTKSFLDKITRASMNQWKVFQIFNGVSVGAFLFLVGRDVYLGVLSVGEIVVFYSYLNSMMGISDQIVNIYGDLIESKTGIERMMDIFHLQNHNHEKTAGFPQNWKEIKIMNGNFRYKKDAGLKNINLNIKRGEKIGIVGKTGSGKSTLAKALLGLYQLSGEYTIDGRDFYSIKSERVFEHMSIVPQEIDMFNISLRENITLFREVDLKLLDRAIETSQLCEVIGALPHGLDTIIGEKGHRLSGGERQRIGIARALCRNSQILLMDEATSALDYKTEGLVYKALEENFSDKTIITIAHRINTLENTDKIYILEKGEIVEEKKFSALNNK